jgi:hypothetical protein
MDKVETALSYALGLEPLPDHSCEEEYTNSEEASEADELDELEPVSEESSPRRRWTEATKFAFLLAFEEATNDAELQLKLCENWGFANFASAASTARRFKKQQEE